MNAAVERILAEGRTGDGLLASGKGSRISTYIKWATRSPYSHYAQLVEARFCGQRELLVAESTMSSTIPDIVTVAAGKPEIIKGVQLHPFSKWVNAYQGEVWYCPLLDRLTFHEEKTLLDWIFEQRAKRVPYDLAQAMGAGIDFWDYWFSNEPDFDKLYCTEFALRGFQVIGRLGKDVNPSESVPADMLIYDLLYQPEQVK